MKVLHVFLCALAAAALAARADAQEQLYACTAFGHPGELYIINAATGATVQDIGPLNDASSTNYGITGLAFNPVTGVLYGSTADNVAATRAQLVTIDPATARVTVVGPFNTGSSPATMTDLAFTPSGRLYGIGSVGGAHLYSINTATGQATRVGDSGFMFTTGGGLAISPSGTFYGTPGTTLFGTYNPTTGAYTNIAAPTRPAGGGAYNGLAFNSAGVLYGLNGGPMVTTPHLVTIDPATAAVTDIGPTAGANFLDGLAFRPAPVPEPGGVLLACRGPAGPTPPGVGDAGRPAALWHNTGGAAGGWAPTGPACLLPPPRPAGYNRTRRGNRCGAPR
jgi:hypothetical protein